MDKVIDLIKEFFADNHWKYDYLPEKQTFVSNVDLDNCVGVLRIFIFVRETEYLVYAILGNHVNKDSYMRVSEFLHRANYGLPDGNFEFDYSNGEVRYKTYMNFKDGNISRDIIDDTVYVPIAMFERYGESLFKAIFGNEDIEQLVNAAEEKDQVPNK